MPRPPRFRRLRMAAALVTAGGLMGAGLLIADGWQAFGKAADGDRRARMRASPQWAGSVFDNPQPLWNDVWGSVVTMFNVSPVASPSAPVEVEPGDRSRFARASRSGLRITWLGHSTQLIEIDGTTVLTDPIFGGRASPFTWAGPEVWYDPPIPLDQLPNLDAVLISHDHYDHLQLQTIQAMATWDTRFIVPLGVGAHLEYWGVPADRIDEVDWWDEVTVGAVTVVATPARHASGRQLLDQNSTLWAGYALVGPNHRVYFSGDTGLFPGMTDIGDRLGPFDATLIEVGAYNRAWPDWHLGPEQALRAHEMVQGELFLPVHWGLWALSSHGWTEPAERVLVEAERRGMTAFVPHPGQTIEPAALPVLTRWWPDLPWQTVAEHPVNATAVPPE